MYLYHAIRKYHKFLSQKLSYLYPGKHTVYQLEQWSVIHFHGYLDHFQSIHSNEPLRERPHLRHIRSK